ncbi:rod shape-determining protein MreC [Amphibacillus marinus]|uniref:Cell shape-determining protein MreC n=1 Tax=Amphibacillus marinus TaxID=872970 RepID=A0A1H8P2R4_9BACI|nr:rod shape-determining protein MreC [Amphibacillus marinus]SEO36117.1 rod shape-determining protein MreC [Amphibacillus marinus]
MSFFRRKRLFLILLSLIILVGLVGLTIRDRDQLSAVEEFFQDAVGWVQKVALAPVNYTVNLIGNVDDMRNVYNENQVLKENLAQYQQTLYEVQELRRDNEELLAIIDKTDNIMDYTPIQASVVARSPEAWFNQVTIDRGSQHGVAQDMAVITADGMIGKIQSTSQFTSNVLLLNGFDRSNRISVNVSLPEQDDDARGFILGYNEERNQLVLEFTEYYEEIPEDAFVFSSGLGGVFPKGLEVGSIDEVTTDQYGLTQIAYVSPSANLTDFNHVIVVDRNITSDLDLDEGEEE